MKNSIWILLCLLLVFSCKSNDDEPKIIEESQVWEENDLFVFDRKVQSNSYADDENIYFLSRDKFSHLKLVNGEQDMTNYALPFLYDQNFKMPISSKAFITAANDFAFIIPTASPVGQKVRIDMSEIDADYQGFDFPMFHRSEAMVINERLEVLIPYYTSNELKLLLVRLSQDSSNWFEIIETRQYSEPRSFTGFHAMYTFNNHFYVARLNHTYRIDENYQMEKISDTGFFRMFELDNQLYGLAESGELHVSDNGINWTALGSLNRNFSLLNYGKIHGRTIAYYNSQLFELTRSENGLVPVELDNVGLDGNLITSVSVFENRIYVTTFSGVFIKDAAEFWKPKEEETGP